ncbi:hypothetical protein DIPPA_35928 [Diplonema papillatum]|nr:hypothetical protein DIPPA_35928 [Diplonema papillatum]
MDEREMVDQRVGAFKAFDLDGTGLITHIDLKFAFQAVETIATLISDKEVTIAMRRSGVPPGSMITPDSFSRMCDVVEGFLRPRRKIEEYASYLPLQEAEEEVAMCQGSPRRTTRSMPLELWHEGRVDDENIIPAPLPNSPTSPRACLGDVPGMDSVAHAFYAFDMDYSGAVSGCELPNMLRLVPRRRGAGTLGRPSGDNKQRAKLQRRWDEALHQSLHYIGKQLADLVNLHDFQAIVDILDPPPPPQAPLEPDDEGYETTESEKQRRAEEEERRRREEEARKEAEKINAATLVVQFDEGYVVLHFCEEGDSVGSIMRKIIEKVPHLNQRDMRLVGRGFEMDPRNTLQYYGVKVGHPQTHAGDILQLMIRVEEPDKNEFPEIVSGLVNLRREDGTIARVYAEDDEPIEHFMMRIEEQEGTPVPYQRLVTKGREMNCRKTLADYDVQFGPQGDIVELLVRQVPALPQHRQWG